MERETAEAALIPSAVFHAAMRKVGLDPEDKTKVEHYSLGMKQKLGITQAIMENQDILILDEPFNAPDYKTYNDIKEIIRILQAEERTILMTSHNYGDHKCCPHCSFLILLGYKFSPRCLGR